MLQFGVFIFNCIAMGTRTMAGFQVVSLAPLRTAFPLNHFGGGNYTHHHHSRADTLAKATFSGNSFEYSIILQKTNVLTFEIKKSKSKSIVPYNSSVNTLFWDSYTFQQLFTPCVPHGTPFHSLAVLQYYWSVELNHIEHRGSILNSA